MGMIKASSSWLYALIVEHASMKLFRCPHSSAFLTATSRHFRKSPEMHLDNCQMMINMSIRRPDFLRLLVVKPVMAMTWSAY